MNTKSCEYLIAIAEKKTLSAAAKVLGISQPTLSTFLSSTENELDHELFTRFKKEFIPTEAGKIYLEACREIVNIKNRTYQSMLSMSSPCPEHFTIGITPHRGSTMFSQAFSEFYHRYPNVNINVKEGYFSTLLHALDTGETDIILSATTDDDSEKYSIVKHNIEELYLCVPDFHPLAALANPPGSPMASIDILRFQDTPFVMWGSETTNKKVVQRMFHDVNMEPTIVYESNNVMLIDNMIQNGVGVGFLPRVYCKPNQNRVYFSLTPPLTCNIGSCYRKSETLSEPQRYFIYLITKLRLLSSDGNSLNFNDLAMDILNEFTEDI